MGADNTTNNWSDAGATAGTGTTDGSSRVDATQPLRTTQGPTGSTGSGGVVEQAQEGASKVVERVQETAGDVAGQMQQQAKSRLNEGKDRASSTLGEVAEALRETGSTLGDRDQPEIANYANQAASQVERLSTWLQNRDVDDIIIEVQRFARRQPGIFLGTAFALGLLGARFLKSSGQQAQQAQWGTDSTGTGYSSGYGTTNYGRTSRYEGTSGAGYSARTTGSYGASGAMGGAGTDASGYSGVVDDTGDVLAGDDLTPGGTPGYSTNNPSTEA